MTVARGVTVGTIEVVNSTISFNTTQGTYQIVLAAQLPVFNPNYAAVGGDWIGLLVLKMWASGGSQNVM